MIENDGDVDDGRPTPDDEISGDKEVDQTPFQLSVSMEWFSVSKGKLPIMDLCC